MPSLARSLLRVPVRCSVLLLGVSLLSLAAPAAPGADAAELTKAGFAPATTSASTSTAPNVTAPNVTAPNITAPDVTAPNITTTSKNNAAKRPVRAVVDLSEQHAYFYAADGSVVRRIPVSTGAPKTRTRLGRFKVYSRSATTFSRPSPDVKMRYMTRFDGAIGFHGIPYRVRAGLEVPLATPLGERGVSHGCVRMRNQDARWVFQVLPTGATVVVQN